MRLQVPRAACLEAAVEMLLKSKHDFALLYVGKRQPDPVPAALAAQVAELTAAGKLLEAERADFGVLFRQVHHAPRTTHHASRTTHHAPCTVHRAPCIMHHAPYTVHTTRHAPCHALPADGRLRRAWRAGDHC